MENQSMLINIDKVNRKSIEVAHPEGSTARWPFHLPTPGNIYRKIRPKSGVNCRDSVSYTYSLITVGLIGVGTSLSISPTGVVGYAS